MRSAGGPDPIQFDPDWVVAPAAPLTSWLREHRMTAATLARRADKGDAGLKAHLCIRDVLAREALLPAHADVLEAGTGIPASFWLRFEQMYREGLAAGKLEL